MAEYDSENGYQSTEHDPFDWKENFHEVIDSLLPRFDKSLEEGETELARQVLMETQNPSEGMRDSYWGTNPNVAEVRDKMDERQYELQKKRMEMQMQMSNQEKSKE